MKNRQQNPITFNIQGLSLTLILFLSLTLRITAQEIKISSEGSKEINDFAASIRNIETFFNAEPLPIYIRLFECGRTVGFLPQGLDVILYDFYVSVKQATEEKPIGEYGYFWVTGHFIDPRNYVFEPESRTLTFEHGTEEETKTTTLKITFKAISVK